MAMSEGQILIVGCGPGAEEYVCPAARAATAAADVLVGSPRLLAMFPKAPDTVPWAGSSDEMLSKIETLRGAGKRVAVLVSGDPGLFSFSQNIVQHFGRDACRIIPAVSSVQVAFARLGLDWAGATILSAHGRLPHQTPSDLAGDDRIAVLAGTPPGLAWCGRLAEALAQTHAAFVCEHLTLDSERVRRMEARQVAGCDASSLTLILLIRNELLT